MFNAFYREGSEESVTVVILIQARDGDGDACQERPVFNLLRGGGLWTGEAVTGDTLVPGQSHEGHHHHEQGAPADQLPVQGAGLAVWFSVD